MFVLGWLGVTGSMPSIYQKWGLHLFPWYGVSAYLLGMYHHCQGKEFLAFGERTGFRILGALALGVECVTLYSLGKEPILLISVCRLLEIPLLLAIINILEGRLCRCRVWNVLSEASFFIYASHFLLSSLVYHTLRTIVKARVFQSLTVGVFEYVIGGLALMVLSRFLLKKISPRILAILEGKESAFLGRS